MKELHTKHIEGYDQGLFPISIVADIGKLADILNHFLTCRLKEKDSIQEGDMYGVLQPFFEYCIRIYLKENRAMQFSSFLLIEHARRTVNLSSIITLDQDIRDILIEKIYPPAKDHKK